MRVATNLQSDALAGIEQSESNLQTALLQVSTGQRVNLPGDDPTASALMVQNTAETDDIDQYTTNANAALGATQVADAVVSSVVSLLNQAVSLGVEGASSTNTAANRAVLAQQVTSILTSVVSQANTNYQGVPVFGGTSTNTVPFVADSSASTGYIYQGNDDTNEVQVGDTMKVQVNLSGATVFTNPSGSVLGALSQLSTALTGGTTASIGAATSAVTNALSILSAQHGVYGNSINQLNAQESFLAQDKITLSTQASNLVDVDTATAAENLSQAQAQDSAVLAAAAKVLPVTLLDYLK